jgi:flagellar hook assembly protein FlgD
MRKRILFFVGATVAALLVLAGCQTAKPVTAQQSMIETESPGFSPKAEDGRTTIDFGLLFGNKDLVSSWQVQVVGAGGPEKTFTGDGKNLPGTLTWDGTNDAKALVAEGTYTAALSVDYAGKLPRATAASQPFVVDLTPPEAVLHVTPTQFTPSGQGESSPVTMSVDASSPIAKIQSWSVNVFDPSGKLFASFSEKWPDSKVSWDGKGLSGDFVTPSSTYSAVAIVSDQYGLQSTIKADIGVGAPAVAQVTVPPAPVPAGTDAVQASLRGFSPKSETASRTIDLRLTFGDPASVHSWKVTLESSGGSVARSWTGDGRNLPRALSWDGRTGTGAFAPDGTYTAALAVDYGAAHPQSTAASSPFILDVTPPSGSVALSEPLFSPIESADTLTLTVNASSPVAGIDSWSMNIYDPGGSLFRSFSARWPQKQAVWNGKGLKGDMVQSAEDYPLKVSVRDEFGNVGTLAGKVPIDILVYRTATGYRIQSSRIFFKPFTADYRDVPAEIARQNAARLDALAAKLEKFRDYKVKLVGHAVMIYWNDIGRGKIEQADVLIPLSEARARAIVEAMVRRGLAASMLTAEGVGAADQIVPDSNYKDRWQNRRVAFFLEK